MDSSPSLSPLEDGEDDGDLEGWGDWRKGAGAGTSCSFAVPRGRRPALRIPNMESVGRVYERGEEEGWGAGGGTAAS